MGLYPNKRFHRYKGYHRNEEEEEQRGEAPRKDLRHCCFPSVVERDRRDVSYLLQTAIACRQERLYLLTVLYHPPRRRTRERTATALRNCGTLQLADTVTLFTKDLAKDPRSRRTY